MKEGSKEKLRQLSKVICHDICTGKCDYNIVSNCKVHKLINELLEEC